MNHDKHEKLYKKILALEKELNELYRIKWTTPPIKLDKPIAHGYIRYLQIRPENRLRGDYPQIKKAFDLVGQKHAFHKSKDFTIKHKNHTQEKHACLGWFIDPRFRYYITSEKQLLDYEKINECVDHLKHVDSFYKCNCGSSSREKDFLPHYEFKKPWLLEEKTEIHWLTHYTPIDGDIESKISNLNKKMWRYNGWGVLYGRVGNGYESDYDTQYGILKSKTHGYLHGFPRPRIDELYPEV